VDTGALVADVAAWLMNAIDELGRDVEIGELPIVRADRASSAACFRTYRERFRLAA
jgi:hypothetical protein